MVTFKIGDQRIPNILLDTGCTFDGILIYNTKYADSLNHPRKMRVKIPGAGGGEPSTGYLIDSVDIALGSTNIQNQRLLIMEGNAFDDFASNGVIGYTLFLNFVVELHYDEKILILHDHDRFKAPAEWIQVPIYFKHNKIPWLDVSLAVKDEEPVQIATYIDFAAAENIELLEREVMKYNLPQERTEKYLGRGLNGDIFGQMGYISRLLIGPFEFTDVAAAIVPAAIRSKQANADAIIGSGCLSRFNLIFDYPRQILYLQKIVQ
jgi:hypothetical protein